MAQQVCQTHGDEIEQPLVASERANTFTLREESEGFCQFGAGLEEDQLPSRLSIEETMPGAVYLVSRVFGIVLQLGAASVVLRFLVDPVLDFYRSIRRRFGPQK